MTCALSGSGKTFVKSLNSLSVVIAVDRRRRLGRRVALERYSWRARRSRRRRAAPGECIAIQLTTPKPVELRNNFGARTGVVMHSLAHFYEGLCSLVAASCLRGILGREYRLRRVLPPGHSSRAAQDSIAAGPKLPKPWLVRLISERHRENTPRALSFALNLSQSRRTNEPTVWSEAGTLQRGQTNCDS